MPERSFETEEFIEESIESRSSTEGSMEDFFWGF